MARPKAAVVTMGCKSLEKGMRTVAFGGLQKDQNWLLVSDMLIQAYQSMWPYGLKLQRFLCCPVSTKVETIAVARVPLDAASPGSTDAYFRYAAWMQLVRGSLASLPFSHRTFKILHISQHVHCSNSNSVPCCLSTPLVMLFWAAMLQATTLRPLGGC